MTARKTAQNESWDAFWAEAARRETVEIRGVEVPVPTDMPMIAAQRAEELQDSSSMEDVAELVALIFGEDLLQKWLDGGMGLREFQTVLTWGMAHANGNDMSFARALELVENGDGATAGKAPAPNRAARRAPSGRTGGPSKATSRGSTGSRRATSRT